MVGRDRVGQGAPDGAADDRERHWPIEAWIIDDTSFPKQGKHSVGVHRQYCGQLGKQANCQAVVTLSIANHHASLPIAYRLYPPDNGPRMPNVARRRASPRRSPSRPATNRARQIRAACAAGVARGVVLMDAAYGCHSALRHGVSALALRYVAAIAWTIKVQAVTAGGKLGLRMSAKELALGLPKGSLAHDRHGAKAPTSGSPLRFARVRVRTSPIRRAKERAEETLLIEWPEGEAKPSQYWLSTLPEGISLRRLVDIAKMRWRIERDYQELKQEIGLGHYEGRGWTGFHHHGTLCIAAYGFLISEKGDNPPLRTRWRREPRETCPTRRLPTPRRPRSGLSGTSPTRSPPSIAHWRWRSRARYRDAHAAHVASRETPGVLYDAVRLAPDLIRGVLRRTFHCAA